MSIPTTPIPHADLEHAISKRNDARLSVTNSTTLQAIYFNTFSLTGEQYLRQIVQQVASRTNAELVLILQTVPRHEYFNQNNHQQHVPESANNKGNKVQAMITTADNSYPGFVVNDKSGNTKTSKGQRIHIIRFAYTSSTSNFTLQEGMSIATMVESPYAKLFDEPMCCLPNGTDVKLPGHPKIANFVGVRLEEKEDNILGAFCIVNSQSTTDESLCILEALKTRTAREMDQLNEKERLMKAKDEARLDAESKIKFLADMSHEIRTPMNAVIALTDLLLQERASFSEEQTEHLEVIQTSGHHLLTVINDILDISKINHDPKFKLERRVFSLRKCTKDALNMARHQAAMTQHDKNVQLVECPATLDDRTPLQEMIEKMKASGLISSSLTGGKYENILPLIWRIDENVPDLLLGDTMRLTQIVLNLCSNAVKFTKQGGIRVSIKKCLPTPIAPSSWQPTQMTYKQRYAAKIETMWSKTDNNVNEGDSPSTTDSDQPAPRAVLEISVTDTGIGIPAERLPMLFKSFSQLDVSTARQYGGTGLGLAISSTLVNRMGGCLWVESEEGKGSRFALTLPLTVATPESVAAQIDESHTLSSPAANPDEVDMIKSSDANDTLTNADTMQSSAFTEEARQTTDHKVSPNGMVVDSLATRNTATTATEHTSENAMAVDLPPAINSSVSVEDADDDVSTSSRAIAPLDLSTATGTHSQRQQQQQQQRQNRKMSPRPDENIALQYPVKILLAEDNILNQKIAVSILRRLGYHDVQVASNGREVLELMQQNKFDVIFMDLYMPEMDGLETTRSIIAEREKALEANNEGELKSQPRLLNVNDVYIIALTASASSKDREICINAGMNDFISKPFTMMEVKTALINCVGRRKKRKKQPYPCHS